MEKRTAYLFHLLSSSRMADLRGLLIQSAAQSLMNPSEEHVTGFLCDKDRRNELWFFEDEAKHLLFLEYYWWTVKRYLDFEEQTQKVYLPHQDSVVVDLETRVLYVYTSAITDAIRIGKILATPLSDPPFELINYPSGFIRWLADEGQERSTIVINAGKTKFDKVDQIFSGDRRLVIDPTLQVRDSRFWNEVRNSLIAYCEITFRISDTVIPILVYGSGKYTLVKTEGATPQEIGHLLRHAYLELDRLRSIWEDESASVSSSSQP